MSAMTREAFENALRGFRRAEPFRPFHVERLTGRLICVDDPDALANAGGTAVFVGAAEGFASFDHTSVARFFYSEEPADSAARS